MIKTNLMKTLILILLSFINSAVWASLDSLIVESKITEVTVYKQGAQIERKAKHKGKIGNHIIIFENLPFHLIEENIQIKCNKLQHIQSIKHEKVFGSASEKTPYILKYEKRIKEILRHNKTLNVELKVLEKEEQLLSNNSNFNTDEKHVNLTELKQSVAFFTSKIESIHKKKLNIEFQKETLNAEVKALQQAIQTEQVSNNKNTSRIILVVDNKSTEPTNYTFSYFMDNASWIPNYNFRVDDIDKPLNIDFKAKVFQTTGEDWENVNLTLSTNQPRLNVISNNLDKWILEQPTYSRSSKHYGNIGKRGFGLIYGCVTEAGSGETVPLANVVVKAGNKIIAGGATDFDGNFYINEIPSGSYSVEVSFIGFSTTTLSGVNVSAKNPIPLNVKIYEEGNLLNSVALETEAYEEPMIDPFKSGTVYTSEDIHGQPSSYRTSTSNHYSKPEEKKPKITSVIDHIMNDFKQNITHHEYAISVPFTVLNDGKENDLLIQTKTINTNYNYLALPKLSNEVQLNAKIEQWQELNFLEGNVNIFFNGKYIGKTLLTTSELSDTLSLSLGYDDFIQVKREHIIQESNKVELANKIKETVTSLITIKNNKSTPIQITVQDQIPVTSRKNIFIESIDLNGGKLDKETGIITWDISLKPNEQKQLKFSFYAKYPKEYDY